MRLILRPPNNIIDSASGRLAPDCAGSNRFGARLAIKSETRPTTRHRSLLWDDRDILPVIVNNSTSTYTAPGLGTLLLAIETLCLLHTCSKNILNYRCCTNCCTITCTHAYIICIIHWQSVYVCNVFGKHWLRRAWRVVCYQAILAILAICWCSRREWCARCSRYDAPTPRFTTLINLSEHVCNRVMGVRMFIPEIDFYWSEPRIQSAEYSDSLLYGRFAREAHYRLLQNIFIHEDVYRILRDYYLGAYAVVYWRKSTSAVK